MGKEAVEDGPERPFAAYEAEVEAMLDRDDIIDLHRRTRPLSYPEAQRIGWWMSDVLSLEGPDGFREMARGVGYALGRTLAWREPDADPGDVKRMASKLYTRLQIEERGTRAVYDMLSTGELLGGDAEIYGHPGGEALRHLEDSILMGYWDA